MNIRPATHADIPVLQKLIAESVRGLSVGFYTPEQIETALAEMFGVDTQLIDDQTYYIIEGEHGPAAAGGWSGRKTLFGGSHFKHSGNPHASAAHAGDPRLDPATEPARIRAFFVHPDYARRGLARQLFNTCARAAHQAGFRQFELMATMPGRPLYTALGFNDVEAVELPMTGGVSLPLMRMSRSIDGESA